MKKPRPESPVERLEHDCTCGQKVIVTIGHYQRVMCRSCGLIWWALQPKRDGLLKLFVWPGLEMANENEE